MKCVICGEENSDSAKFCIACGSGLVTNEPTENHEKSDIQQPESIPQAPQTQFVLPDKETHQQPYIAPAGQEAPQQPYIAPDQATPQQPYTAQPPYPYPPNDNQQGYYAPQGQGVPTPGGYPYYNNAYVPPAKTAKKNTMVKLLAIAVPLAAVIALCVMFLPSLLNSGGVVITNNIEFYGTEDGSIVLINDNTPIKFDEDIISMEKNFDASKAVVLVDNGSDGYTGSLWYVSANDKFKIADDVASYVMSDSGDGIAYCVKNDDENYTGNLNLYVVSKKEVQLISKNVFYEFSMSISPDGKTVAYVEGNYYEDDEFTGYIKKTGADAEKLGANKRCIAVSDNAIYAYYVKYSGSGEELYVKNGENDIKLAIYPDSILFNADYSQVIVSYDNKAYISLNGKDKQKIANASVWGVLLHDRQSINYNSFNEYLTNVYNIKDFAGVSLISNNDDVLYINKDYETTKVISSTYSGNYQMAANGKTIFYLDRSDKLCKMDVSRPDAEKIIIAEDVYSFLPTDDGNTVYYINSYDELWAAVGTSKPVKISDDVYGGLVIQQGSNRVFFLTDYSSYSGTLYYSDNGGKRVKVQGADDVYSMHSGGKYIYYFSEYDSDSSTCDVYINSGDGKSIKLAEGVFK